MIDTIGYDARAQFTDGFIHGPNLRSVERYRVIEGGKTLEKVFTFTDPDALTEPYSFTRTVHRTDKPFQEYVNAQNNTLYQVPHLRRRIELQARPELSGGQTERALLAVAARPRPRRSACRS